MPKITTLTPEQIARFPEFVRKWTAIGLSTQPADRDRAEKAIAGLYRLAKLKEPRVIWLPCPISAALSAVCYASIVARTRLGDAPVSKDKKRAVGSAVRSDVYSAVESAVDSAVYSAGQSYFGGSVWNAGYSAWADYFNEVLSIEIDRNFLEMTSTCGFYWVLDNICFASERPSEIHLDQGGELHSENGKAISYAGTGWGIYAWHGSRISDDHSWIITDKTRISAETIMAEPNAELRRIMCGVTSFDPIRAIAKVISEDVDCNGLPRRLMVATIAGDDIRIIEVNNGTLEPDGSRRKFILGALRGDTPQECVARSYGFAQTAFREGART